MMYFLLRYKKNIILQGAPSVEMTYAAKLLAYSMMGQQFFGKHPLFDSPDRPFSCST